MRVFLAAFLAFLLSLAYLLPHLGVELPPEAPIYINGTLSLLTVWIMVEALAWISRQRQLRSELENAREGQRNLAELESQLIEARDLIERERTRAIRHEQASEGAEAKIGELEVALKAAEAKAQSVARKLELESVKSGDADVLNFLGLLQQKGRFLDFIMDDITKYPDARVGAAARIVHQGCSAVMREYFAIKPVNDEPEGSAIHLDRGFDPKRYRLMGRVAGEPPYRGKVLHRGWQTETVQLPRAATVGDQGAPQKIITPAEVEIS